jgi:hypothetical protein
MAKMPSNPPWFRPVRRKKLVQIRLGNEKNIDCLSQLSLSDPEILSGLGQTVPGWRRAVARTELFGERASIGKS